VDFIIPGLKHACPMVAACWSPATPRIGIAAPKMSAWVVPKSSAQSLTSGSMARGTRSRSSSSSSHALVSILYIRVRQAWVASVACTLPPVSRQIR